jgi:hypothetical protein
MPHWIPQAPISGASTTHANSAAGDSTLELHSSMPAVTNTACGAPVIESLRRSPRATTPSASLQFGPSTGKQRREVSLSEPTRLGEVPKRVCRSRVGTGTFDFCILKLLIV